MDLLEKLGAKIDEWIYDIEEKKELKEEREEEEKVFNLSLKINRAFEDKLDFYKYYTFSYDFTPLDLTDRSASHSKKLKVGEDGLAPVRENDKYDGLCGYADKDGNIIIKYQYENAGSFRYGFAAVKIGEKWGFINTKGDVVIPPEYDTVSGMTSDKYAIVKKGEKYGIIDETGTVAVNIQYDEICTHRMLYIGWVSMHENSEYFIPQRMFSDGLVQVRQNDKWGFIDKSGNMIIEPQFDEVEVDVRNRCAFNNGMAIVCLNDAYWLVDTKGRKIYPFESSLLTFDKIKGDLIKYGNYRQCGILNEKTGEFSDPEFEDIKLYGDKLFAKEKGGLWGCIDDDGNYIIEPKFNDLGEIGKNGLIPASIAIEDTVKYGYINLDCEFIIKPRYDNAKSFGDSEYAPVQINKLWGYIDTNGKKRVSPRFDDALPFSCGLAAVKENGKYGYMDDSNEIVIKCQFDNAYPFKDDGYATVIINELSQEERDKFSEDDSFYDVECEHDEQAMFINRDGHIMNWKATGTVISKFTSLIPYQSSRYIYHDGQNVFLWGYYSIVNNKKYRVIEPSFIEAGYVDETGKALVVNRSGKSGYITIHE